MRSLLPLLFVPMLPQTPASATPTSRSAVDTFGAHLHGAIDGRKGNFLYSPSSIAMALAMAREGAAGGTAAEMDAVLGKTVGSEAKAMLKQLRSSPKPSPASPLRRSCRSRTASTATSRLRR